MRSFNFFYYKGGLLNDPCSRYTEITSFALYIPVTSSETSTIIVPVNMLSSFEDIHHDEIAKILQISAQKAYQLSQSFRQIMIKPFGAAYAQANIFPIPFYHPYFRRNYLKYPIHLLYCM